MSQQLLRSSFCGLGLDLLFVLGSVISASQHGSVVADALSDEEGLDLPVHLICFNLRRIRNVCVIEEILDTET